MSNVSLPRSLRKFTFHPLIYTRLVFNLAQDIGRKDQIEKGPADRSNVDRRGTII
jgi:hypothetical protein